MQNCGEIAQHRSVETEQLNEDILFELRIWIINRSLSKRTFMDLLCLMSQGDFTLSTLSSQAGPSPWDHSRLDVCDMPEILERSCISAQFLHHRDARYSADFFDRCFLTGL